MAKEQNYGNKARAASSSGYKGKVVSSGEEMDGEMVLRPVRRPMPAEEPGSPLSWAPVSEPGGSQMVLAEQEKKVIEACARGTESSQ